MFEQERVIGRLQRYVVTDPAIKACFLSGSFGRRAADAYSDIDVAIVYANEASRQRAWGDRAAMASAIMPYISSKAFDDDRRHPALYVVLLANGSKLDLRFETMEALQPDPWDAQIRILKDSDGWAERYAAQSISLAKPQPLITRDQLENIDNRFWVTYWDILRQVARGEVVIPFPAYLGLLHETIPPLLAALPDAEPARKTLVDAAYSTSAKATAAHLQHLLAAYLAARNVLVSHYHLQPVGNPGFEREIQSQIKKLI